MIIHLFLFGVVKVLMWLLREFLENQLMAIFWRMFRKKVRPKWQFHGPCEQEPVERTGVYGLSFKAQGSMEATRSSSQLHTYPCPPKKSYFPHFGNFLTDIGVLYKQIAGGSGWSMDIGVGTLQHTTRHSFGLSGNKNSKDLQWEGQRSRISRDPNSRTLGVFPWRGDLRYSTW